MDPTTCIFSKIVRRIYTLLGNDHEHALWTPEVAFFANKLCRIYPLLGNDHEITSYRTVVAK
jgi:hypothetical protein